MTGEGCRKRRLTKSLWLLLLLIVVFISGCWDRRELENLAVVMGIGINRPPEGEGYEVSYQIVRAAQLHSPGGGGGSGQDLRPFWILRSRGPTVFEAIRNATFQSSRKLFLSHCQVIVVNEAVAREGLTSILDFFTRDHEPRLTLWLLLTPEDPVQILDAAAGLERVSSQAISDLLQFYQSTSKIRPVQLAEFVRLSMARTADNTFPIIKTTENAGKKEFILDGSGVIKGDKLVGYLDPRETRGLLWVLGKVKSGLVTVEVPGEKGKATFEIFNSSAAVKVQANADQVHVKIEVRVRSGLGTQTTTADLSTPDQFKKLEKKQEETIKGEIEAALAKAREYKADIFGFGRHLYSYDHRAWRRLVADWERHFVVATVEIKVKAVLDKLGLITRPALK
ncbi:MAG: Ger(x)C family spore germination protein [Firmicutes bacterium]|nr:Ger(x)C family spore germination protein [Bacillota bacterium]